MKAPRIICSVTIIISVKFLSMDCFSFRSANSICIGACTYVLIHHSTTEHQNRMETRGEWRELLWILLTFTQSGVPYSIGRPQASPLETRSLGAGRYFETQMDLMPFTVFISLCVAVHLLDLMVVYHSIEEKEFNVCYGLIIFSRNWIVSPLEIEFLK